MKLGRGITYFLGREKQKKKPKSAARKWYGVAKKIKHLSAVRRRAKLLPWDFPKPERMLKARNGKPSTTPPRLSPQGGDLAFHGIRQPKQITSNPHAFLSIVKKK
jgi:hypothetical protein